MADCLSDKSRGVFPVIQNVRFSNQMEAARFVLSYAQCMINNKIQVLDMLEN